MSEPKRCDQCGEPDPKGLWPCPIVDSAEAVWLCGDCNRKWMAEDNADSIRDYWERVRKWEVAQQETKT